MLTSIAILAWLVCKSFFLILLIWLSFLKDWTDMDRAELQGGTLPLGSRMGLFGRGLLDIGSINCSVVVGLLNFFLLLFKSLLLVLLLLP